MGESEEEEGSREGEMKAAPAPEDKWPQGMGRDGWDPLGMEILCSLELFRAWLGQGWGWRPGRTRDGAEDGAGAGKSLLSHVIFFSSTAKNTDLATPRGLGNQCHCHQALPGRTPPSPIQTKKGSLPFDVSEPKRSSGAAFNPKRNGANFIPARSGCCEPGGAGAACLQAKA